ncbi:MAG: hypothetical protein K9N05_07430 [Candidatus Marinimicrobia bacterium]|nr:hypothetical protein [Candidatus Neomarinimicrobiota bacterium]
MKIAKILTILFIILPMGLIAGYASYGNDYLNLLRGPGGELYGAAYGLMQYGSENTMLNPARLSETSNKSLYLYHSTWFRNEVSASSVAFTFNYKDQHIGVMVSRIGISDIPDSRNALLDYGLDGIPGTGDTGEGNGQLDENEIIDYDGVLFTGIANYTIHLGLPVYQKGNFSFGLNLGFLYTSLIETNGYGLTFDLHAEHKGKYVQSLYSLKNLPSAIMVFNSGNAQYYPPQFKGAWLVPFTVGDFKFKPGISSAVSITENLDYYMFSIGSVLAFDIQPLIQIEYKNLVAAGISYRWGDGLHAGIEFNMPFLDVSYSFRPSINGDLGSSHLISLRISTDIFK